MARSSNTGNTGGLADAAARSGLGCFWAAAQRLLDLVGKPQQVHIQPLIQFPLLLVAREIADQCGFGRIPSQLFDGSEIVLHFSPFALMFSGERCHVAWSGARG